MIYAALKSPVSLITMLLFAATASFAQTSAINKAHSHNDYKQNIPFLQAYYAQAGSIEADVFYLDNKLYVAHERKEIEQGRTLTELYLKPLAALFRKNGGRSYADSSLHLQLVVDIKEDKAHVIPALIKELEPFKDVFQSNNKSTVKVVLSGDMPAPAEFEKYPAYIYFDGRPNINYTDAQLKRVAMISDDLGSYTEWNGKGVLTRPDSVKLTTIINNAHAKGKPFRFWATQDSPNTWIQLQKLGADWINTDHPQQLHDFLANRHKLEFINPKPHPVYTPTYKTDGVKKPVKNIILLIGDGMGLAQIQAGLTANHGQLNLLQCRYSGFSQTRAANSDNTDSAAGATAMATGHKTNNRYISINPAGQALTRIPDTLAAKKIKSGIISCADITDATPAAFYAHNMERSNSTAIAADLLTSNVDVLIGSNQKSFFNNPDAGLMQRLKARGYTVDTTLAALQQRQQGKQLVLLADAETRPVIQGRGDMLAQSLKETIRLLSTNKNGFFIMAEGARIDHGGHANDLPFLVTEMLDFDRTIGEALRFADQDGETLVIVTADHETGGLSLLDASTAEGRVLGNFSTNDHTSINVPVFAYGPNAGEFMGTYQNTEIFNKVVKLLLGSR
ncbi:alkaline phosphatase [Mucilaginibacter sp. UR6-1]|uniref:alkaline phosphatase n=1 Tax=Mucilaginibacter sp. UR6-1 TaxID=1435643 RepID=UPI001E5DBA3F|nr:alkaline phosphatase [Mucilaginibacter sp. UR6-1]MCC8410605.1 alkaline phosphatase [Mucilaginibacter sp. UR6-1]